MLTGSCLWLGHGPTALCDRIDVTVRPSQHNGDGLVFQVAFTSERCCKRRASARFDDKLQPLEGIAYGAPQIGVTYSDRT